MALILTVNSITAAEVGPVGSPQTQPTLTVNPSTLAIKVGGNATAKVALTGFPPISGEICFSVLGFPSSGFVVAFSPTCANTNALGSTNSALTVEATPAAAPQNFTAFVVAASGNWTETTPLNITVEPGLPAWIPWSIILLFVLVIMASTLVTRLRPKKPGRR